MILMFYVVVNFVNIQLSTELGMIVMFKVVINFVSIASYDIAVKDIGKQPTKGLGQLNKTYVCVMHTN